MKPDLEEKKTLRNKLFYLKHNMAKFFDCDDDFIKFSNPVYYNDRFKIEVELTIINRELDSLNTIHGNTFLFNIEGEYINREKIWFEGNFYYYYEINELFKRISLEIKDLK